MAAVNQSTDAIDNNATILPMNILIMLASLINTDWFFYNMTLIRLSNILLMLRVNLCYKNMEMAELNIS